MRDKFTRLYRGNILGVIDAQGQVFSKFTAETVEHHSRYWNFGRIRWRWNYDKGIHWFSCDHKPDEEQIEAVQCHLTREYGLHWQENGHHNLDHFMAKLKKEQRATR